MSRWIVRSSGLSAIAPRLVSILNSVSANITRVQALNAGRKARQPAQKRKNLNNTDNARQLVGVVVN